MIAGAESAATVHQNDGFLVQLLHQSTSSQSSSIPLDGGLLLVLRLLLQECLKGLHGKVMMSTKSAILLRRSH